MPIFEEDGSSPVTEEDGVTALDDEVGDGESPDPGGYLGSSMARQATNLNELDGAIGTLPSGAKALAVVGAANSGPLNTPSAYARTKDLIATFGGGPLVEAASIWIQQYRRPVVVVRTGASTSASCGTIDVTGVTGTSTVTLGADTTPDDDYEAYFRVIKGGTIGSAGITFAWSLDGGRTMSAETALGTATTFAFPNSGGIGLAFAAGTLVAGDVARYRGNAPSWNGSELGTALAALQLSKLVWEIVHVVGPVDGAAVDVIVTSFPNTTEKAWIGNFRMPNAGETEAAYLTAYTTALGGKASTTGGVGFGAAKTVSGVSFRQYRRPMSWCAAPLIASVDEHIDPSRPISVNAMKGVEIRDLNGNPDEHDEAANPGADDVRALTLTTYAGNGGTNDIEGVYLTNPRLLSPSGSDFEFFQHRRVMNLAKATLRAFLQLRTSKEILVDGKTGFILESEALEIEEGGKAAMRSVLGVGPKISGDPEFTLSRTDNLLSTKTLTGQARIIPLAYPKFINIDIGFQNPALRVVAV